MYFEGDGLAGETTGGSPAMPTVTLSPGRTLILVIAGARLPPGTFLR